MKEDVQSCQAKECGPRLIEQYADPLRVWAKLVISFLVVYFALQYRDGEGHVDSYLRTRGTPHFTVLLPTVGQALILLVSCLCCWALIPCINAATLPCARKEVLLCQSPFLCATSSSALGRYKWPFTSIELGQADGVSVMLSTRSKFGRKIQPPKSTHDPVLRNPPAVSMDAVLQFARATDRACSVLQVVSNHSALMKESASCCRNLRGLEKKR
eukprot:191348-Pelagomonas_calceolata.AAC.1